MNDAPKAAISRISLNQWLKSADPDHRHIERLILLSDGVYAISLTLLALDIRPPVHWDRQLSSLVSELALPLSAYFFAFFVLALNWAQHRQMFAFLRRIDGLSTGLHFANLSFVALTPAAISLLVANNLAYPGIVAYAACTILLKLLEAAFWGYVGLVRDFVDPHITRAYRAWRLVGDVAMLAAVGALVIGVAPPDGAKIELSRVSVWSWGVFWLGLAVQVLAKRQIRRVVISRTSATEPAH